MALCLDSLLNQDLNAEQYEIICVDDGSTDSSTEILTQYESTCSNIKVIRQENSGHAAARNTGLAASVGKYIWFVDSDDFVDLQCFGFLINTIVETNADIFCVHYQPFFDNKELPVAPKKYIHKSKKQKTEIACSGIRIFRASLIKENNIVWNKELSPCDDIEFIFFAQINAQKIVFNNSVSYYHRKWSGAVTGQKSLNHREKFMNSFFILANEYNAELSKHKYSKKLCREIQQRKGLCVQAILMELAIYEDADTIDEYLVKLKSEGLYPYKKIAYNLRPKLSVKRTLMDFSQYFFTNEKYYRLMCKVIKKIKR